jgi:hypothetical protein
MKLIVKLLIAAVLANAAWRVGSAYAAFYKFKDAVYQTAQYGPARSDAELRERVLELAVQYDLPLSEEGFTITREENHTIVDGGYTVPIEFFPGVRREWPFTFNVDTFVIKGAAGIK